MSSCTSPLYRVPVGSLNFGRLLPSDQSRRRNGGVFLRYDELKEYEKLDGWYPDSVQVIRCQQCASCRLKSSFDWAIRCSLEAEEHEHNYFVTLTYDDFHLPRGEFVDFKGDVYDSNLRLKDCQLFLKNLREWERTVNSNTGVKVFYCGEYGDLNGRPHYHLCLFGVSNIPDLVFQRRSGEFNYYKSVLYESFWSDKSLGLGIPRGFVDITDLSFDTVAYTARYVMKKQKGLIKKDFLEFYNTLSDPLPLRTQPFICMSRRPGLAASYYERNKGQILSEDLIKDQKKFKLYAVMPARYFSKLLERDFPDDYEVIKNKRRRSGIAARKLKLMSVSESESDRLLRDSDIINSKERRFRIKSL